jgi:hypothetical protein
MGVIGTIYKCLIIFLKKSLRKIDFFKYLLINTIVNLILAFSIIFFFYYCLHIFFYLALSIYARKFVTFVINDIISFFNLFSTLIEIMINLEKAIYFRNEFQKFHGFCFITYWNLWNTGIKYLFISNSIFHLFIVNASNSLNYINFYYY